MKFTRPGLFSYKLLITFVTSLLCFLLSACASDSYTAKGATKGAVQGAAAGAVGGLISALVFGGDPVDRAARGAVYGGAIGAVSGGVAGHQVDKRVKAQEQAVADARARERARARAQAQARTQTQPYDDADLDLLRHEIGEYAFEGLASLAECRHDVTMSNAKKAQKSSNPNYRLAGLWLELLNYADLGKKKRTRKMLPVIVKADWDINTEAEAKQATYDGVAELAEIRKEFNLPVSCRY